MAEKKDDAEADKTMADLHAELVDAAAPLIMGFRHVSLGDRALTAADARAFLDLNMVMLDLDEAGKPKSLSFAEQVLRFAGQRANFLPRQPTA